MVRRLLTGNAAAAWGARLAGEAIDDKRPGEITPLDDVTALREWLDSVG